MSAGSNVIAPAATPTSDLMIESVREERHDRECERAEMALGEVKALRGV